MLLLAESNTSHLAFTEVSQRGVVDEVVCLGEPEVVWVDAVVVVHHHPRLRLDTGTWGVMGIGMGYAIAAAVTSGKQVIAIEGDSAFMFVLTAPLWIWITRLVA